MLHRYARLFIFALALPALAGCVGPLSSEAGRISPDAAALVIEVDNLNWWDMEVELDAEGRQYRLGVAPSYGKVRFLVSDSRLGGASYFRLLGNPLDTGRTAFASITGDGLITTRLIELEDRRFVHWSVGSDESTTFLVIR